MAQYKEEDDIIEESEDPVDDAESVTNIMQDVCGNSIQHEQVDATIRNVNVINNKNSANPQHKSKHRKLSIDKIFRRQRLISTSLSKSPILDDELKDFHNHKLKSSADPLDLKYKLYAVVVSCFFHFIY